MVKNKLFMSTVSVAVASTCVVPVGMNISVEAATPNFSDVSKSNSHYAAIMELASRGIIKGYSDGTFAPEKQVTRGQAAKMIAAVLGLDTGNGANVGFRDVSPQNEYAGAIAALKQAGIIDGYEDGTFRPNESIKRNHMAKIITRAIGLQGSGSVELSFTDLHSDYKEAISALFEYGITKGTTATKFGGENFVTRGQLASFIIRAEKAVQAVQPQQPEQEKPSAKIVEASITIEDIEKNKVKAEDQEWTIGENVQAILNEGNAAALEGARIDVILVDGEIADLLFIELNTSGQEGANITLNGGNSIFAGNITVNADFVELKNMIVTENVVLTDRAKTNVAINQVEVKGELIILERAPIVTASLTNVATQFFVTEGVGGLTLSILSGVVRSIVAAGPATINSDRQIPQLFIYPTSPIDINAPSVGVADMYLGQSSEVSGTATIDNLILRSPEDLQRLSLELLNQQQGLLMEQQAFLERSQEQFKKNLDQLIEQMLKDLEHKNQGVTPQPTFSPSQEITKQQLTEMVVRLLQNPNLTQQQQGHQQEISDWAQATVQQAYQQGLLQNPMRTQQNQQMLDDLRKRMELIRQQKEQANQQIVRPVGNAPIPNLNIGGSLNIGNLLVATPQANIGLQPAVRITNVRATVSLEQLRGMIAAQPGQITNFMTATNTQVPFNPPSSSNSTDSGSSGGSSSGGGTDTGFTNTDLLRLQQAIVEAKSGLVEVSKDGSDIAITRQWTTPEVKAKFSEVLEETERTAAKVNVTNPEALTAYNKLIAAKRVYDSGKQYGTMKLSTESLGNYISMAKQKLTELEESISFGDLAISDNGQDISQENQWIPRSVKEAIVTTIADAEKMLENAESGASQRIASLTDMNILLANAALSQEDLDKMAEKLEKLMNIYPLSGLQEVTVMRNLLTGQQISLENEETTNLSKIAEEINKLITVSNYSITEGQLSINGNQVTVNLHEAITYLNPETFEFTEMIPAITAQVTIVTSFQTELLEIYLEKVKEKSEEIKDIAVSVDGADISRSEQWISTSVMDTFLAQIVEAEAMLVKAQQGDSTLTQAVIIRMAEKLETSINMRTVNGLKEATEAKKLLNSQQIAIPSSDISKTEIILARIKNLEAANDAIQELGEHNLEINNYQVTITLSEAIEYQDFNTYELIEIVPAITAQVTIIPEIRFDMAALTLNELVLTISDSINMDVGELLTFTVDGREIEGTVAENQPDNKIRIEFGSNEIQLNNIITAISSEKYQFILPIEGLTVVQE